MAKKWLSCGLAALALAAWTGSAAAQTPSFTDIGSSYAQKEISALAQKQVLNGIGNGRFNPTGTMTREDFAVVLAKCLGLTPNSQAAAGFTDLDNYARPYVGALVNSGLAHGYSATSYGGRNPVSRQDLAVFFMRAFGQESFANHMSLTSTYTDEAQVATYAKPMVALAQRTGFMVGTSNGNGTSALSPTNQADRQAVARLAYEFYVNKAKYTDAFAAMSRVDSLLYAMAQATNAQQNYQIVLDISSANTAQPTTEHVLSDLNTNPLAMHQAGTLTYYDQTGKQVTQPVNAYLVGGNLYTLVGSNWVKTPFTSQTLNLPGQIPADKYHTLASYLTVTAEDNNTVTLGGTMANRDYVVHFPNPQTDLSQLDNVKYTIVMDKTTNLEKSVTTVVTQTTGEQDTIDAVMQNYGQVGTITLPPEVTA